ncbi:hypothetical protein N8496_02780 [Akkermansiaceae bacterium]|nr:hypothetical protein [Akkermansiaceae bacterium]
MSKITTDEVRICKECSESYKYVPSYWPDEQSGRDLNVDCYHCPSCEQIRWEKERRQQEKEDAAKAAEEAAKAAWIKAVPPLYRDTDTAHPDYPQAVHRKAIEWQKTRETGEGNGRLFLGLIGDSGRCKTRVISQVTKRIIWNGHCCQWVNATEFQRLVQSQWSNEKKSSNRIFESSTTVGEQARASLRILRTCDTLTLDDLGKGRITDTVAGALYDLLEERTAQGRTTLWTSNASLDNLLQMLPADCGGPIVRRLLDFSTIIKL